MTNMVVDECAFSVRSDGVCHDGTCAYDVSCQVLTGEGMPVGVHSAFIEGPGHSELVPSDYARQILEVMRQLRDARGAHERALRAFERATARSCRRLRADGIEITLVDVSPSTIVLHRAEWDGQLYFEITMRMLAENLEPRLFVMGASEPGEFVDYLETSLASELRELHARRAEQGTVPASRKAA